MDVVVTVATYRRPDLLQELLSSLEGAYARQPFRTIVIDNDAAGSGQGPVSESPLPITYIVEPEPGIVAARNAALDALPADATHVAFVDDDEVVPEHWLRSLLDCLALHSVDIATGPVTSVFGPDAPPWIVKGGYIQRSPQPSGPTETHIPASNNTLVTRAALDRMESPRFDPTFSVTGGSDTEFFTRMKLAGAQVAWCEEAAVAERVPSDRLTFRWVMRRYIRINNVSGRLRLASVSRFRLAAEGIGSIAYGIPRVAVALLLGKGLRLADTRYVTRGIGWLGASSGRLVQEYSRPKRP